MDLAARRRRWEVTPGHTEESVSGGEALRGESPAPWVRLLEVVQELDDELAELARNPAELRQAADLVLAAVARHLPGVRATAVAISVVEVVTSTPAKPGATARLMRAVAELLNAREALAVADPAAFARADALVTRLVLGEPGGEA